MHNLGDQWMEEIDGKRHMLMRVQDKKKGCVTVNLNIDLGIVNDDGFLPEERTGEYPKSEDIHKWYCPKYVLLFDSSDGKITIIVHGDTKQEVIDRWNQRYVKGVEK